MVRSVNQSFKPLLLLISLTVFSLQSLASYTASVNRNSIAQYETFELTLRTDSDTSSAPDLDGLNQEFDVLGTRQNRQVRIINGKSESWRDWVVTLSPKKVGRLVIPEIPLGDLQSQAIAIQVSAGSTSTDNADNVSPVFIKSSVNSEAVFVQQEIVLTLQIFHRVELYDDRRLTPLNIENALIQQLGETRSYDTVMNGVRFGVMELSFSIHPQQSGLLEIPSLTFSSSMSDRRSNFGSFFSTGSGKPVIARSPEMVISVQPQPATYSGNIWLPAKNLTLTDGWSSSLDDIKVGDAITRTIVIQAEGLSSNQLPSINMPKPQGINTYPDQSATDDRASDTGIVGSRIEAMALVPTKPGTITLPPIRYRWFDTQTNSEQIAEIPAKTLTIKPSDKVEPVVASIPEQPQDIESKPLECLDPQIIPPSDSGDYKLWQTVSAALGAGWLLTLIWLGLKNRKRKTSGELPSSDASSSSSEKRTFDELKAACQSNNYSLARQCFITWRQSVTGINHSVLDHFLNDIDDENLRTLFSQAEAGQYSSEKNAVDCKALLKAVTKMRSRRDDRKQGEKDGKPNPLYPGNPTGSSK